MFETGQTRLGLRPIYRAEGSLSGHLCHEVSVMIKTGIAVGVVDSDGSKCGRVDAQSCTGLANEKAPGGYGRQSSA
jgi:hypothetical protein